MALYNIAFDMNNKTEWLNHYSIEKKAGFVFESVNNLELTNSPLAPSLYEVPNYISKLTNYYEQEIRYLFVGWCGRYGCIDRL